MANGPSIANAASMIARALYPVASTDGARGERGGLSLDINY
ncbi:MAG: hypothetical protein NVSMB6_25230 [Burkholderiaceae bacterium]